MSHSTKRQPEVEGDGVVPDSLSLITQVETDNGCDGNTLHVSIDEDSNLGLTSTEVKQKERTVSIDVTKALLLLGFASWTALEPGEIIFSVNPTSHGGYFNKLQSYINIC